MSFAPLGTGQEFDADARLYMIACASCHYNAGRSPLAVRPDLTLNSAVNLPDPTNLIEVVMHGVGANEGIPGVVMPGFAQALSDTDIARIAAYLRRTRTNLPTWPDLDPKIAAIRLQISASR
jgi:mono/diheme cytochrome c family protein